MQPRYQMERNCSGPLQNRQRKDFNYSAPGNPYRTKMLLLHYQFELSQMLILQIFKMKIRRGSIRRGCG